jgi:hypothetical protein
MTSRKLRKKDDLYFNKFYISPWLIVIIEEVIEWWKMKRKMNLYSIDSRIDSRIDDEWENDGRVMDGYKQEKRLFFSFQFDLTVDWKIYNDYFLFDSKIVSS